MGAWGGSYWEVPSRSTAVGVLDPDLRLENHDLMEVTSSCRAVCDRLRRSLSRNQASLRGRRGTRAGRGALPFVGSGYLLLLGDVHPVGLRHEGQDLFDFSLETGEEPFRFLEIVLPARDFHLMCDVGEC